MAIDNAADGMAVIRNSQGEIYPVPQTAANMMVEAGSGSVVSEGHAGFADAMRSAIASGADRPHYPTVY